MTNMTKHPLRITVDALKKAFALTGFKLYDNGEYPELEKTEVNIKVFENPEAIRRPILLMDGQYALRTQILPYLLAQAAADGEDFAVAAGKVFDGSVPNYPARFVAEGVISSELTLYDLGVLWNKIVKYAFGAAYSAELRMSGRKSNAADLSTWGKGAMSDNTLREPLVWEIYVTDPDGGTFVLGAFGTLTWMGDALYGKIRQPGTRYAFSVDIDAAACRMFGLAERADLFRNTQDFLGSFKDGSVSVTDAFEDRCRDVLRTMGYSEGFGPKIYPDGIYKKMNMIQDEWDLNNKGVPLKESLGDGVGLPTVLTPAIEQILSEKWAAGEKTARTFEISHIFMPRRGASPIEKLAVSFGAYGENIDFDAFKREVGDFLTKIGNRNHFFIPTTMAIAYNTSECCVILDEKMQYLDGNFGGISAIAEKNFGIGTHAFMTNLEIMALKRKADEEYGYIAPELR